MNNCSELTFLRGRNTFKETHLNQLGNLTALPNYSKSPVCSQTPLQTDFKMSPSPIRSLMDLKIPPYFHLNCPQTSSVRAPNCGPLTTHNRDHNTNCQTSSSITSHNSGLKRKRLDDSLTSNGDGQSEGYHSSEEEYSISSSAPTHPISNLKRIRLNGVDFFSDLHGYVHGYCDGAFKRKTAAIGIWFSPDHPKNLGKIAGLKKGNITCSNQAELKAAIKLIKVAYDCGVRRLQANVDSKYVIQCAKGHLRQATFKRNRSLIEKLVNLTKPPMKVYWNHVQSHAGVEGNEEADLLAEGALRRHWYGRGKENTKRRRFA